ncbi:MAG TPA: PqqD family protein [Longimicrobiaceae bacterium]|nr:PqqD family protein [Longimicrobiaceae bacterium]
MEITPGTLVAAARDQVSCELEGEAVILNLADQVYYGLDPVGARVWALLREPRSVAELRDTLVAEYEVDAATAERDLIALLTELTARRLVDVRGEPSA